MAQTTTSAPQQGVAMPAVDLRQMVGALVAVEGVRTTTDLLVSQRGAGANMSVDIAPGSCVITDDHASGGGVYSYTLGSTTNVAVGTANATNPRIDRVVVTVLDNALGDASNSAAVSVIAGTATSGATLTNLSGAAAVPSSSLLLANVLVPTSSTSVTTANIANIAPLVKVTSSTTTVLYNSGFIGSTTATLDTGTMIVPSWVNHIRVRLQGRSTYATATDNPRIQFNGDSTTGHYTWSATGGATSSASDTALQLPPFASAFVPANIYTEAEVVIPFAASGLWKNWHSSIGGGDVTTTQTSYNYGGTWENTAAISRVAASLLHGSWAANSSMIVYGDA